MTKYFKLDIEVIREILLVVGGLGTIEQQDAFMTKLKNNDQIQNFHIAILHDAKYLEAIIPPRSDGYRHVVTVKQLTWSGYDLLESIKEDEIWRQTKDACTKIGSFAIPIVQKVAAGILGKMIAGFL